MTSRAAAYSIRQILIALGIVGVLYVLALTLEVAVVLQPAARRLEGTTGAVLADHDTIAARLRMMRRSLEAVRGFAAASDPGLRRSPRLGALTEEIRARLGDEVAMRESIERTEAPTEVRLRLAQAVESETAADLALLDAIRALGLGRAGNAASALEGASSHLDSTASRLSDVQRSAIGNVLLRQNHLLDGIHRLGRWAIVWLALGGVLLLLTGWVLGERLYRPIADLERAVARITAGDLQATAPVRREDELGRLAEHVNAMTEVLRERSTEAARRHHTLEERFGRVLDQASNEILLFDSVSLRCIQANRGAQVNLGYTLEEMSGLTLHDVVAYRDRATLDADLAQLRHGQRDRLLLTGTNTRKDGSRYPVEMTLQSVTSEEAPLLVAVAEDISTRSRMRELNERVRQFALTEHRLIGAGDLVPALEAISKMATQTLQVDRTVVWFHGTGRLRGLAAYDVDGGSGPSLPELTEGMFPAFFASLAEGRDLAVDDARQDPRTAELVEASTGRAGVRAMLAAPVRTGGRLIAVVAQEVDRAPRPWSSEEQSFIGSVAGLVALAMEAAERRGLESQLAQAKKMDSIGRLAGGVAHDFNNLLTAILGNVEIARERMTPGNPARAELDEIEQASRRAADLTRQLLTFARRQVIEPRIVDVNALTQGVEKLLRRLIGEDVELSVLLTPDRCTVRADPGQLEQVLVNLAANARDAMPGGGRLVIETRNVTLDDDYAEQHPDTVPGEYVQLSITDSGTGMDRDTQARLFEPFFTTKDPGRGTGLGLAICYGIVRQAGGNVWVYSEPGRGSTFKVHLPRMDGAPTVADPRPATAPSDQGVETILVVEDERQIRDLIIRMLTVRGYRVTAVADAQQALTLVRGAEAPPDLVVTDVVLPGMGGPALVEELRRAYPQLPVVYMSGYTAETAADRDLTDEFAIFLSKPFTPAELGRVVREALGRRR